MRKRNLTDEVRRLVGKRDPRKLKRADRDQILASLQEKWKSITRQQVFSSLNLLKKQLQKNKEKETVKVKRGKTVRKFTGNTGRNLLERFDSLLAGFNELRADLVQAISAQAIQEVRTVISSIDQVLKRHRYR